VDWLGEDLLLLALDAGRGTLERTFALGYGLMGADLVRLGGGLPLTTSRLIDRAWRDGCHPAYEMA
jgi:hypothetical protein